MRRIVTCSAPPKWRAVVDDRPVPLPDSHLPAAVLKDQGEVPDGYVLVRDHNSPHDVVIDDGADVDLTDGNVFYAVPRDARPSPGKCATPAKRAVFVDDRFEVVTRTDHTGASLRRLFGLPPDSPLRRDRESPDDEPVGPADRVDFADGPVFHTRGGGPVGLSITVNARLFGPDDGVRTRMTGAEVAALVYPEKPRATRVTLTGGREVGHDEEIGICGGESFDVVRERVEGGFAPSRVEAEVDLLRDGDASVTLSKTPPAIIYHDLAVTPGLPVERTDVLVPIPDGYPGRLLDGVYLPQGSPLLGKLKGAPQHKNTVTCLGTTWTLVSYHPHREKSGVPWDPTRHGLHTYLGEVLSWLRDPA